jgi:L-ascorbate metabolism protein UlaG (beta-lactamase superfamily)
MIKKIFKLIKRLFLGLGILLALFIIAVSIFVNTQPQMGKAPEGADLERISQSPNYGDGEFINLIETSMGSFSEMMSTMPDFIFGEGGTPEEPMPVKFGENTTPAIDSLCFVTWYGHSAFLFEIEGKRILIDPMLGEHSSPVSFATPRFPYEKPIPIEELTDIDAIILSHDHYDHLDYPTIVKLKEETKHFYTALGVGSHLMHWGVDESKITELDWWQNALHDSIEIIACPARHFSGRGFTDRNATQWASWVIKGKYQNLYFSGDGGYGPHFKEIGEKHGPFDLAMLECGQYNEAWEAIHMMPEQSVQAGIDVQGKLLMPIHWGGFELSVHTWTEPIIRFKAENDKLGTNMVHPFIGERFELGKDYPTEEWWVGLK